MNYQNDAEVEVKAITYERKPEGFADTLHGRFVVHIPRDHKQTELVMTFYKCPKDAVDVCKENAKEFVEDLDCVRFHNDATGPWHMFAPAMDIRNVCAESQGEYELNGARMEGRFLEKYMTVEEGHYRIKMLYHLPGESFDVKNLRGCVELDFDIIA